MEKVFLRQCASNSSIERPESYSRAIKECENITSGINTERQNTTCGINTHNYKSQRNDDSFDDVFNIKNNNDSGLEEGIYRGSTEDTAVTSVTSEPIVFSNSSSCGNQRATLKQKQSLQRKSSEFSNDSSVGSEKSLIQGTYETRGKHSKLYFLLFLGETVIVIVLLVCVSLWIASINQKINEEITDRRAESNTFCLPCNDLLLGPLEEDNVDLQLLNKKTEENVEICCAKGNVQNSVLLNLVLKRREKLQQAQGSSGSNACNCTDQNSNFTNIYNQQTAAHLVAGLQSQQQGEHPYTIKNWIKDGLLAHARNVEIQDSRMIVKEPGLYLVYSQILFLNVYKGQLATNTSQTLYHYVYKWNIIYPNDGTEMLLKSVRTQCWAENKLYGDYTSYTSGVFQLNRGDNLYVKVSNLDLISRDQRVTFFGIARL